MLIKSLSNFYKFLVSYFLFLLLSTINFFTHMKLVFLRTRVTISRVLKFSVKFLIEQVNGTLFKRSFIGAERW